MELPVKSEALPENTPEYAATCPNFFELEGQELAELRDRVEKCNGLVRVFIHPGSCFENPGREKIKQIFLDVTNRSKDSTPPVIVFEERPYFSILSEGLAKGISEGDNVPYFVETISNGPFPVDEEYPDLNNAYAQRDALAVPGSAHFERDQDYLTKVMNKIATCFTSVGIKKILIGGHQLAYSREDERFERCVGNFLEFIKEYGFEVDVSEATAPISGAEYRKILKNQPKT